MGRGLATEAARGLVSALASPSPSVHTVIAHIHPAHRASESVARACGLHPTREVQDGERRWRLELPALLQ